MVTQTCAFPLSGEYAFSSRDHSSFWNDALGRLVLDRLGAMRVFAKPPRSRIRRSGTIASDEPAAVTRAIASLEDAIGARLFVRTTRSIRLTDAGSRYLEDCRRILADVTAAEAVAAGSYATPSGRLVVTAPVLFGRIHVLPVLTRFLTQYPGVTAQALFLDRTVSLVEEGIDVAVRIGHLSDSEMSAVRVGSVSRVVCAAPSYLERYPEPKTPADLAGHTIIALSNSGTSRGLALRTGWADQRPGPPAPVLQSQRRRDRRRRRRLGRHAGALVPSRHRVPRWPPSPPAVDFEEALAADPHPPPRRDGRRPRRSGASSTMPLAPSARTRCSVGRARALPTETPRFDPERASPCLRRCPIPRVA